MYEVHSYQTRMLEEPPNFFNFCVLRGHFVEVYLYMMFSGGCHDLYKKLEAHYLCIRHHCQIGGHGFGVDIERPPYGESPKKHNKHLPCFGEELSKSCKYIHQ